MDWWMWLALGYVLGMASGVCFGIAIVLRAKKATSPKELAKRLKELERAMDEEEESD